MMEQPQEQAAITLPIALSRTRSATGTQPWFVQQTEYNPEQATFQPLVNGEEAFGAIYDAIDNAKCTVDIICWGFQPSMYFKRGARNSTLTIGTLLAKIAHPKNNNVKVRVLCWENTLAQLGENMVPGYSEAMTRIKEFTSHQWWLEWIYSLPVLSDVLSEDYEKGWEDDFDIQWHRAAGNVTGGKSPRKDAYPNIEFAIRDFSAEDKKGIRARMEAHNVEIDKAVKSGHPPASGAVSVMAMSNAPSHHQKMVLIDYEDPDNALGFVMGHNMLDQYWDTDDHSCVRKQPDEGRNGPHPRQDISSRVSGPILDWLNKNFCEAWDKATGQNLTAQRAQFEGKAPLRRDSSDPLVMAQLLRTQSQYKTFDIEKLYMQAVNNVTSFIYIENQYFRWPELADKIKAAANTQMEWGRDPGEHGPIYLFVVTNSNDEAIGVGTVNTYAMLDQLGQADKIKNVARAERSDTLPQQLDIARQQLRTAQQNQADYAKDPEARPMLDSEVRDAQKKVDSLKQQIKDNEESKSRDTPITSMQTPGLKTLVCTLVAPDTPAGMAWEYVYVHAKLMIVNDVFTTIGSANINLRSMEVDSELNICHENIKVTQPLRRRLWALHTKGAKDGASDEPEKAFVAWSRITKKNTDNQANGKSPIASLIEFSYTSNKRTRLE